jgi:hypothetical protein
MTVSEYKKKLRKTITDSIKKRWMIWAENPDSDDITECQLCELHDEIRLLVDTDISRCDACPFPCCYDDGSIWFRFCDASDDEARKIALEVIEVLKAINVDAHAKLLLDDGIFTKGGKR